MPVYTKLYGLFFLIVCVVSFAISYCFRASKKRSAITGVFLLLADLIFYTYAGVLFLPALIYISAIAYIGGLVLSRKKALFPLFTVLLFLPLVTYKVLDWNKTGILLPLGISFFTLQAYSYLHDVYTGEMKAESSPITIALFTSFFPSVSSGPILRAQSLIPQLKEAHDFDYTRVTDGMKLYCFGLFKKLVLADNIALYIQNVNSEFAAGNIHPLAVLLSAVLYSFELYLDFSGYSDIVIGCAKILGFDIDRNFHHPYLSKTITEFWRRWHTSLSSWLRDYIYFPLGGSKKGTARTYINIIIIFLVSGLWHGNGLNFIVWGLLHGIFQCIERFILKASHYKYRGSRIITFILVTFAWMFFSDGSISVTLSKLTCFTGIPAAVTTALSGVVPIQDLLLIPDGFDLVLLLAGLVLFCLISIVTAKKDGLVLIKNIPAVPRWLLYYALILFILFFAAATPVNFIYNKF